MDSSGSKRKFRVSRSESPQLHLVTDPRLGSRELLGAVEAAAHGGIDLVQVRDHAATAQDLFDLSRRIVSICRPLGVRVAVNDRIDVALAVGADAVQLGSRSLPVAVAKRIAGPLLIGASVHSLSEASKAERDGADWITFGHFFPTGTHPNEPCRDIAELKIVADTAGIPVIAIGGIGLEQVGTVIEAGAGGIAVISAILDAPDPGRAAGGLRAALDMGRRSP